MKIDKRLFKEIRKYKLSLISTTILSFLIGVLIVLQARYFSKIVNLAFLKKYSLKQLYPLILLLVVIIILRAVALYLNSVVTTNISIKTRHNLRKRLIKKIVSLGPSFTSKELTGELTTTLTEGIEKLDPYIREYIPQIILTAVIPIMVLFFVFPRDFYTGLIFIITAPLIPFFMYLIGLAAEKITKKQWETLSKMSAYLLDVIQGLTTLKVLNRSKEEKERLKRTVEEFRKTTISVLKVAFISALTLELIATLSTAIVAVEIGLRLLYGKLAFEQAFFILLLAPEFYTPFRQLGAKFHSGMAGVEAANRIYQILSIQNHETHNQLKKIDFNNRILFKEVKFSYGDREALRGINFELRKGEKIALVGPTGAGKSTIASLLLKFITPDEGEVFVDSTPLSTICGDTWRQLISWVPQSPYIFNTTIMENILIARPGATYEEVVEAAKAAHAHEFITKLKYGYKTIVGERGAKLSGGQAQRIAIARAFLKNSPILILDEATANLDPEIERMITDATYRLLQSKTALIIAHRISTIFKADRIIVLENGKIVEQGTHELLMKRGKLYPRLVKKYRGEYENL